MKYSGWYSVVIGVMIILQWGFFILTGNVPEFRTEPVRIAFHLAAEAITAILLIIAGIAQLKKKRWGKQIGLIAYGTLIYTVIVSPGYFAQQGEWGLVGMFAVVLLLTLIGMRGLIRTSK